MINGSNTKIKFQDCVFDSNRVTDNNDGGASYYYGIRLSPVLQAAPLLITYVTDTDGGAEVVVRSKLKVA